MNLQEPLYFSQQTKIYAREIGNLEQPQISGLIQTAYKDWSNSQTHRQALNYEQRTAYYMQNSP